MVAEFIHPPIHPSKLLGSGGFMSGTEAEAEDDEAAKPGPQGSQNLSQ